MKEGKLGITELDEKIRWMTSHLAVVTGSPTSGKSEFVDFIISKLNILHGWKCAYYSQENSSIPIHFARIFSKFVGKKYKKGVITVAEPSKFNVAKSSPVWTNPPKFEYVPLATAKYNWGPSGVPGVVSGVATPLKVVFLMRLPTPVSSNAFSVSEYCHQVDVVVL